MHGFREMNSGVVRDISLNMQTQYLNVAALTSGVATINNQNAAMFVTDGRFGTKAAGASAIASAAGAFRTIADGNTFYMNLLLGSDGAWLVQQGLATEGVPDPEALDTALNGAITALSTANPSSVTSVAHGLKTGDEILIVGLPRLTGINHTRFKITRTSADAFTLDGVNGAAIVGGPYVSGGHWYSQKLARAYCGVIKVVLSGSVGFLPGTGLWNATGVTATFQHYSVAPVGKYV